MEQENKGEIMKKIGIITIVDYDNYGNRLQNYATQKILINKGYEVETIKNIPPTRMQEKQKKSNLTNKIFSLPRRIYNRPLNLKRRSNFNKFTEHIKETSFEVTVDNKNLNEIKKFNGLVIGSDQIWNPIFRRNFFLDLVEDIDVPSISLAASFGISQLPNENVQFYKDNLRNLKEISVREFEGRDIVNSIIGIIPSVIIDPTMMLSKKDWIEVSKPHQKKPNKKYILTYSLGGLSSSADNLLNDILDKDDYEIVNLGNIKNRKYYDAGPSEFIDFIKDASLLITDSFHGIVFSMIFETPFVIFDREDYTGEASMNSRINTFFKHFDLNDRKLSSITLENVFCMNLQDQLKTLEFKKEEFRKFLEKGEIHFE